MRPLRIAILVLLAVLLPIRGAVAAAMACPSGPVSQAQVGLAGPGHQALHALHALHAGHGQHGDGAVSHHVDDRGPAGTLAHDGAHPHTCPFCASGCCVMPLASAPPAVACPLLTNAVEFPALSAPVPAFQSEGQDRPPRTL